MAHAPLALSGASGRTMLAFRAALVAEQVADVIAR